MKRIKHAPVEQISSNLIEIQDALKSEFTAIANERINLAMPSKKWGKE